MGHSIVMITECRVQKHRGIWVKKRCVCYRWKVKVLTEQVPFLKGNKSF